MKKRQKIRLILLLGMSFIFPAVYYYMSPYLIIDASFNRIISGSFILFVVQFISAIFLGRAFCGWICPAGGIQEAAGFAVQKKVRRNYFIKWIIWVPWIAFILFIAIMNHGYNKIEPGYQTVYGLSISNVYSLITYLLVLLLIVIPAFLVGKRSFCHHVCWMAPFMILGRAISNLAKLPALRLKPIAAQCVHCHTCTENCPMSLSVENMVANNHLENSECILCLTCADGCKNNAIQVTFK